MKKIISVFALLVSTISISQTCNLLNQACANTVGLNTSGITANAGTTLACTGGNYVLYSSSTNAYIATGDLLVNQGNASTLHFTAKKNSTYTSTCEIWALVGGYCNFSVYTSPFNTNGWVQIGTFNPTTTCSNFGPFTIPSDIAGGEIISYCIVLKNASSTNWVSIDDICVSQIAGSAVPTTYNETFGTSPSGWYPASGYIGIPYHTYKNASDAYVILGAGQGGGLDKAAYFYTGFDFCSTVSGTGIVTKEINTAGYTNGEVRISFKSRYPCSGTLNYTFDEDYTSYSPEVFIMEGPDNGINTWVPLPINYYFADYTWRVASYDISAYKNSNIRIKVERGGFCGTSMEAVDNIKVLDRNCAISLLSCGTITGEAAPLANTDYAYTVPTVVGATYYKWFVRSQGNLYDASPYIVSGQGTQNVTINFGSLPTTGLRVICIPYDANPSVIADACYAQLGYLGVTISTITPLTVDSNGATNVLCNGFNDGSISLTVSGGTPGYTYSWIPNVSTTNSATGLAPGSYQITVTDQNSDQVIETVLITEPDELIVSGFSDQIICNGDTYTSTLSVNGGDGTYTYLWSPSTNVSNVNALNPNFSPTTLTTYSLTVTDGNGCVDNGQFEIQVNLIPIVSFFASPNLGCAPHSVNFTNTTLNSSSCLFNFGDGNTSISCSSANNTYLNPGTYSVALDITDNNGCSNSVTYTNFIQVNAAPVFSLGGPYTICEGQNQLLDAGAGMASYTWNTGETTQTISADTSGNYTVTIMNFSGCQSTENATVNVISSTLDLGGPYTICDGDNLILDAGAGFVSYDWNTTETSQTISVNSSGVYSVDAIDANGCVATGSAATTIQPLPLVYLGADIITCDSSSVLDAGAGYDTYLWSTTETTQTILAASSGDYWVEVTQGNCSNTDTININIRDCSGLTEGNKDGILVYPNPIKNELFIQNILPNSVIMLYDIDGKVVLQTSSENNSVLVNTSELATGSYVLVVQSQEKIYRLKIIK